MKNLIFILIFLTTTIVFSNEENPSKFIGNIIDEIKPAIMERNNEALEKTMEKYIDFNEIATWIAGKTIWTNTDRKIKSDFIYELKKLMLKTYSKTVYYYIDADVNFLTPKSSNENAVLQKRIQISSIMKKNNKNVNISYRLIKNNNSWLVFDITIEGISILKSLKTQYSEIIKTKGIEYATSKIKQTNES